MLHRELARQLAAKGGLDFGSHEEASEFGLSFAPDMRLPDKLNLYHMDA